MNFKILNLNDLLKNSEKNDFAKLPLNSIIFHANENVLYNIESELYNNKSILLIGTGKIDKFIKKINLLKKLNSLKFKHLVCLATIKHKWANIFIDDWIIAEDTNLDEKEKTLNSILGYMSSKNIKFDAILTFFDPCILMTSYLTSELNFKGIPFDFIDKIKNKYEFRSLCSRLEINHPRFLRIKSCERNNFDLNKLNEFKFPLIIKNIYGVGKGFFCYNFLF